MGFYHVPGTELRMHIISFHLLDDIKGVGLFVSISQKRKLGFRDVRQPAQDHTAIERHKQCEDHRAPKA